MGKDKGRDIHPSTSLSKVGKKKRKKDKDSNDRSNPRPLQRINDSRDEKTGARILAWWELENEANQKSDIITRDFKKERKLGKYKKDKKLRSLEKISNDIEVRYGANGAEVELSKDDIHEGDKKASKEDGKESAKKYKGCEYFTSSRNFCDDGRTCLENKAVDEGTKGRREHVNKQEKGKQKVIADFTSLRSDSAEGEKNLDDEIIHEGLKARAKDKKKHVKKKEKNKEILNSTKLSDDCNWEKDNKQDKKRKRVHHFFEPEQDDGSSWKKAKEASDKENKGISGDGADEASRTHISNMKKNREKERVDVVGCAEFPLEMATRKGKDDQRNVSTANNAEKSKFDIKTVNIGKGGSIKGSNLELRNDTEKDKKKVNFFSAMEEFPPAQASHEKFGSDNYTWGKRFTPEEDELIRKSTMDYIERHNLGEHGLHMVLNSSYYRKQLRFCWKEIGAALPWRHYHTVYFRGINILKRSEPCKWEPEEAELVKRYYAEHGPKWNELAEILGKHRLQIKDFWRRIRLPNQKKGKWSQDEFQALFDLVNLDLRMKAFENKIPNHRVMKDNISWQAISNKLSTRAPHYCCLKWYQQLASSMVQEGHWCDLDDYRMIAALQKMDACCIEDVDWDNLLDNRSGEFCRKRWYEMIRHLDNFWVIPFVEQVDVLSRRYCPDMIPFRQNAHNTNPDS